MGHRSLIREFLRLDVYERQGKEWFSAHGKPMSYVELMPLQNRYVSTLLQENDFFQEGKNIEVEKTLRYVAIPAHQHEFIECVYVVCGSCVQTIDGNVYFHGSGDFILVPPGVSHEITVPEDGLCLTVKLRQETFVSMKVPNLPLFVVPLLFPTGGDRFVLHTLLNIYEQQEGRLVYADELMEQLFCALITYLMQNFRETMHPLITQSLRSYKLIQIVNYTFENYQTITLRSLAREFHYNEAYLSNLIRREMGKTFTEIIREYRLKVAEELLRTTPSMKLAAVCEAVGYNDTTQFIRDFKAQYKVTPAKYKRMKLQLDKI